MGPRALAETVPGNIYFPRLASSISFCFVIFVNSLVRQRQQHRLRDSFHRAPRWLRALPGPAPPTGHAHPPNPAHQMALFLRLRAIPSPDFVSAAWPPRLSFALVCDGARYSPWDETAQEVQTGRR